MAPITELNHETTVPTPNYKSVAAAALLVCIFLAAFVALVHTSTVPQESTVRCVIDTTQQSDGSCMPQER